MKNNLKASLLNLLADNNGSILHWQLPVYIIDVAKEMAKAGEIMFNEDADLYIHPRATVREEGGVVYTEMK